MARTKLPAGLHPARGRLVLLVIFLLVLYVVVPQAGGFSDGWHVLRTAKGNYVALAAGAVIATYGAATMVYQLIALRPLQLKRTLCVQGASAFANRLLPAGLGGATLSAQYLRRQGHTLAQALAVVVVNNVLGVVGHLLLLTVVVVLGGDQAVSQLQVPAIGYVWYGAATVVGTGSVGMLALPKVRMYVQRLIATVAGMLGAYSRRAGALLAALGCAVLITVFYAAAFYWALQAVGAEVSPVQAFIIFTLSVIAGTLTPTPGGLGGVEAGLVAGALAYGEQAPTALAAALLYRLLTYWLPLIPGFLLFLAIRRRYL